MDERIYLDLLTQAIMLGEDALNGSSDSAAIYHMRGRLEEIKKQHETLIKIYRDSLKEEKDV